MTGEFSGAIMELAGPLLEGLEGAGPYLGGAAVGAAGTAASGAFGSGAATSGVSSATPISATGGTPSATGSTTASAGTGGSAAPPSPSFFGNIVKSIGPALAGSVASTGLQAALGGRRGVTVPPPPGAAMIDPEGAQAAAMIRQRQAVAGGLSSTVTPGANSGPAYGTATSGSKGLLGS